MSEALDRVMEALAEASEDEVAVVLGVFSASRPRLATPLTVSRTPLPEAGGSPRIVSEVEWV
ncbi:hypothetical protein ACFY8K_10830 [Streptomyces misionensis]|uniref:hypothetical protein n=1 Tax=Streptomyces misionensis TaxID=67331 RepID=UPI0036BFB4E6